MDYNKLLILVVLTIIFMLSGVDHRTLYILYPVLGILALNQSQFKLELNIATRNTLIALLIITIIFSIQSAFNFQGLYTIQGFLRYWFYFFIFFFLSKLKPKTLELFILMTSILIVISTPYGVYVGIIKGGRYDFFFSHANHLAYVCVLFSFYYLSVFKGNNLIRYAVLLLLFLCVYTTKSTGGLLVFALLLLHSVLTIKKFNLALKSIVIIASIGFLFLLFSFSERLADQLYYIDRYNWTFILERVRSHSAGGAGSGMWRVIHWLSILDEFSREGIFVKLFGAGFDSLSSGHYRYAFMITDPHNDYVRILVEFGFFGFVTFVMFYFKLIKNLNYNLSFMIATLIPMFLGNIIVNFPYVFIASTLIILLNNKVNEKNSVDHSIKG